MLLKQLQQAFSFLEEQLNNEDYSLISQLRKKPLANNPDCEPFN